MQYCGKTLRKGCLEKLAIVKENFTLQKQKYYCEYFQNYLCIFLAQICQIQCSNFINGVVMTKTLSDKETCSSDFQSQNHLPGVEIS